MRTLTQKRAVRRSAALATGAALLFMGLPMQAAQAADGPVSVSITGNLTMGSELTATDKGWPVAGGSTTFAWEACPTVTATEAECTDLTGETSKYTLAFEAAEDLVGKYIRATATRDDNPGVTGVATTSSVVTKANQIAGKVAIELAEGKSFALAGDSLTAIPSGFKGVGTNPADFPTGYNYVWYVDGVEAAEETDTFVLTEDHLGALIHVVVTSTQEGYNDASATSTVVGPVFAGELAEPEISVDGKSDAEDWDGTNWTVDVELTATAASDEGADFWYQWFSGSKLVGTGAKYTPQTSDLGNVLRVKATATKADYVPASKTVPAEKQLGAQAAGPVAIKGDAGLGQTLTADTAAIGQWAWKAGTKSYQWYRSTDTGYVAIAGAISDTYKLADADLLQTVVVGVTNKVSGYVNADNFSEPTAKVRSSQKAGDVTVTGDAVVNSNLTITVKQAAAAVQAAGEWANKANLTYQVLVDGKVTDASEAGLPFTDGKATYTIGAGDWNKKIAFKVTAVSTAEPKLADATATSAEFGPVLREQEAAGPVSITDQKDGIKVGQTLTANTAKAGGLEWPAGATLSYQWYRGAVVVKANGDDPLAGYTAIPGATAATYPVVGADFDRALKVKVTAKEAGYGDVSTVSEASATVAAGTLAGTLSLKGVAAPGQKLTVATAGFPTGTTFVTKWFQLDPVSGDLQDLGRTGSSYTVTADDLGFKIQAQVAATATGYEAKSLTADSVVVTKVVASTVKPTFKSSKSATLTSKAKNALKAKVEAIAADDLISITGTVRGKTSTLAKKRQAAVVDYLKSLGVAEDSILIKASKSKKASTVEFRYTSIV